MPPIARVTDTAFAPADAHGCTLCPHPVTGPSMVGSPDVLVNGLPALRKTSGDTGMHAACCGPNQWYPNAGSSKVYINNLPAVRLGDATKHCGGVGNLITGSPNVIVG